MDGLPAYLKEWGNLHFLTGALVSGIGTWLERRIYKRLKKPLSPSFIS